MSQDELYNAVKEGSPSAVQNLLWKPNIDANAPNQEGKTALHLAAESDRSDNASALLQDRRIDVNFRDPAGRTALHYATSVGATDVVKVLLGAPHIDVNAKDREGGSALRNAAFRGNAEVLKLLLKSKHVDIDIQDNAGCTALIQATIYSEVEKVTLLLQYGALRGLRTIGGSTAQDIALNLSERDPENDSKKKVLALFGEQLESLQTPRRADKVVVSSSEDPELTIVSQLSTISCTVVDGIGTTTESCDVFDFSLPPGDLKGEDSKFIQSVVNNAMGESTHEDTSPHPARPFRDPSPGAYGHKERKWVWLHVPCNNVCYFLKFSFIISN